MANLSRILTIAFLSFIVSCNSSKPTTNKKNENLEKDGYSLGVIEFRNTENCNWIIYDSKKNLKYDPINIEEKKFSPFLKEKKEIYFKYLPLRMKNRCDNITPIKLIEVLSMK